MAVMSLIADLSGLSPLRSKRRRLRVSRPLPAALMAMLAASPAGAQVAGAPSIPAFGAFFPAWLLCAALGIFGAVILRLVFIKIGLDDVLPWPLAVYTAVAVALAVITSSLLFGL